MSPVDWFIAAFMAVCVVGMVYAWRNWSRREDEKWKNLKRSDEVSDAKPFVPETIEERARRAGIKPLDEITDPYEREARKQEIIEHMRSYNR